jgi:hypothetical protein
LEILPTDRLGQLLEVLFVKEPKHPLENLQSPISDHWAQESVPSISWNPAKQATNLIHGEEPHAA